MRDLPRIAILGAGPIGLEAALAAREAGFPFTIYEAGDRVGEHVRRWGHVRLFTSWSDNVSPRMRRALERSDWGAPDPDAYPLGSELVGRLLEPVAALPDVAPRLRTGVRVKAVARRGFVKSDAIGSPERGAEPFRILLDPSGGGERVEEADVVLDCTGTYSNPNPLGDGGIPAPGERMAEDRIDREIPDPARAPEEWRGRRTLLVGSGHSAQTAARELAEVLADGDAGRVVWAVRSEDPDWGAVEDDPLPGRAALARTARELAAGASDALELMTGVVVDSIRPVDGALRVTLRSRFASDAAAKSTGAGPYVDLEVDRIVSLTGAVGDHSIYRQLQVHECYATSGPMKLAAALLGSGSADCLDQAGHGPESLVNPEPDFFLLGSKSYGRNNTFLMRVGWEQVEDVFGLLRASEPPARREAG